MAPLGCLLLGQTGKAFSEHEGNRGERLVAFWQVGSA